MNEIDAMKTLIRRAIKFSDWAAGEGLCPAGYNDTDQEERNPEEFFLAYSTATGDEDWNGLSERIFARIAKLETENERMRKALSEIIGYDRNFYDNGRPGYEKIARDALEGKS